MCICNNEPNNSTMTTSTYVAQIGIEHTVHILNN